MTHEPLLPRLELHPHLVPAPADAMKRTWHRVRAVAFVVLAGLAIIRAGQAANVLVEAESFAQCGGWLVDSQFMDLMGSPYLLAHGLGRPVADATTEVEFPGIGTYRVWVRTKDWVAPWKAPGAPGRFQVTLNGQALPTIFGTEGAQWHWQDGGRVEITERRARLALHDLTGFEGRCDAILFARDTQFVPPNQDPEMAAFRRACLGLPDQPVPAGEFDFVVTGGGIAGTCAALSAARLGLKVALIQDRPVLGGNNSSEVRVWLQGARNKEPWPRIGDVVSELEQKRRAHYGPSNTAELYEDEHKLALVRAEPHLRLFLEHRANGVETNHGIIRAVIAQEINTGRRVRIGGRWFADCTGDAAVGALAGADIQIEPRGRMGPCNLWNVCECKDTNALNTSVVAAAEPQPFPRCPWALDLTDKPFPGRSKTKPDPLKLGGWYWESGFDRDPIQEMEYIRDWNWRAMYGAWDAMKNVDQVLPNHRLNWAAHILGKRESRQLMGDVVLTLEDLKADRKFPDGCVPTGWSNDLHRPDPTYERGFEGDAFIAVADHGRYPAYVERRPFWIPYRSLYSRNIANLLMAGRDISVEHEALGAVRVMRTGGCMGEVVGMAVSLCAKHQVNPRDIYDRYLNELQALMRRGVGRNPQAVPAYENQGESARPVSPQGGRRQPPPPPWLAQAGPNLAAIARVTVSGSLDAQRHPPGLLHDGQAPLEDNSQRWLGSGPIPQTIEMAWNEPQTLNAARLVSGFREVDGTLVAPVSGFEVQIQDGTEWRTVPGTATADNRQIDWYARFDAVQTTRVRWVFSATPGGVSRVWEAALYRLP